LASAALAPVRAWQGIKLVISDNHMGLKGAVTKMLRAIWQRCKGHFARNALAHTGKAQRRIVSAWITDYAGLTRRTHEAVVANNR